MNTFIWIIPAYLFFLWFLYLATRKILFSGTLTHVHLITTVLTSFLFATVLFTAVNLDDSAGNRQESIGLIMQGLTWILVFSQFIYPVNVLLGLLFRKGK